MTEKAANRKGWELECEFYDQVGTLARIYNVRTGAWKRAVDPKHYEPDWVAVIG